MEKGFIICVDDDLAVVETLREQLLRHFGESHEVEIATAGDEGLALIKDLMSRGGSVEVVITDQVMPGLKGDELLEAVHQLLPETIKILLTGQAGLGDAIDAVNRGGLNLFVEKPWDMDAIHGDIDRLIHRYRQNVENQRMLRRLEARVRDLEARILDPEVEM